MPRAIALLLLVALAACGMRGVPDSGRAATRAERAADRGGPIAGAPALALAEVAPGQVLPFGQVAKACGVSGGALGTAIAAQGPYAIHDTDPGSTEPRTHFVTGFADGCPRQVTAALAVFGDPVTHEAFRYESQEGPFGPVDEAYEVVKAAVCHVAHGTPCGAATDSLAADTAFLTVYPAFGAEEHMDLLFHAGEVVAADQPL